MNRNKTRKSEVSGLTFVELVLTATIFALVAVVIYSTFNTGITAWKKAKEAQNLYQNVRLILDKMTCDLENAVIYLGNDDSFDFVGEKDRISFYSSIELFSTLPQQRRLRRITYSLDETKHSLQRLEQSFTEAMQEGLTLSEAQEVAAHIGSLNFFYCYKNEESLPPYEWKDNWKTSNNIPQGIKIELELESEKLVFTKYVFIPTGVKGTPE